MSGSAPRGSTLGYPVQTVNVVNIDTVEDLLADLIASQEGSRETGEVTASTTTTITDSTKSWPTNVFAGALFEIIFGGVKYMRKVVSNTASVLTLDVALPSAPATNTFYWVAPDILGRLRDVISILGEVQAAMVPLAVNATIESGASVSSVIDLQFGFRSVLGVQMPDGWTAARVTFEVSHDNVVFAQLHAPGFAVVTVLAADGAAADLAFSLNPAFFAGWSYVRVRSGTTAAPVTQAAERVLRVLTRAV